MSNYAKGRAKEYACMRQLESENYLPHRSAGSHSQADVIAFLIKDNIPDKPLVRYIQVKAQKYIAKADIKKLQNLFLPQSVQKEIWHYRKYQKEPKVIVVS